MIPAWLRLLAGLVAAAAAVAIVLLIGGAAAAAPDAAGYLGLAARALLFLMLGVLFGYVAVTGLPPVHWWRGAGQPVWPDEPDMALTPDLHRFLARLRERHPGLLECWLLDPVTPGEWRLLVRADPPVVDAVRADWDIRRKDVRLYLLDDATAMVALAWGRSSPVPFAAWDWEPQHEAVAEFRCPVAGDSRLARRLWAGDAGGA